MQEPARHEIHGAESPSPTTRRPPDNRGPGWPTAGSRPPHALEPDELTDDPPPADPALGSGHTESGADQLDPDSPAGTPPPDEPADDTWLTDTLPPDEPADDSWPTDAPLSHEQAGGSWLIDVLSPDELTDGSWRADAPPSEQSAAGSGTTVALRTDEPADDTWLTNARPPEQPAASTGTTDTQPPGKPAARSRPAGGRLRGWPLNRARKKTAMPPDWPPPDAPRPEDEPTVPIEGLSEPVDALGDIPAAVEGLGDNATTERAATDIDEPTDELPIIGRFQDGPPPAPGNRWLIGAGVTAALLLLVGGGALVRGRTDNDPVGYREGAAIPTAVAAPSAAASSPAGDPSAQSPSATAIPSAGPIDPAHSATAPLDGRTESGFDLVDAADAVVLRTADLGSDLYRVVSQTTTPRVTDENGRIRLFLDQGNTTRVEITLSAAVRWDLRVGGGADLRTIDLSGARLATVDLAGSATRINLLLPRPDGTLTVRMSGGVGQFEVHTLSQVPVRVRLGSGAGQVVVDGTSHSGVAAGALFTPERWDEAVDRIDVDAVAGMSTMTVGP